MAKIDLAFCVTESGRIFLRLQSCIRAAEGVVELPVRFFAV